MKVLSLYLFSSLYDSSCTTACVDDVLRIVKYMNPDIFRAGQLVGHIIHMFTQVFGSAGPQRVEHDSNAFFTQELNPRSEVGVIGDKNNLIRQLLVGDSGDVKAKAYVHALLTNIRIDIVSLDVFVGDLTSDEFTQLGRIELPSTTLPSRAAETQRQVRSHAQSLKELLLAGHEGSLGEVKRAGNGVFTLTGVRKRIVEHNTFQRIAFLQMSKAVLANTLPVKVESFEGDNALAHEFTIDDKDNLRHNCLLQQ